MPAPIDDAFRRFQRTGAPDALAVVFDGSAAELLRVASHLTHDLHAAEDLVQTTFLVAIEERHAFTARSGGAFGCEAVPPGDWNVHLVFRHSGALRADRIGHVAGLRAGETRRFDADIGDLRPGRLQARVLLDGVPYRNARITLRGSAPPEQGEIFFHGPPSGRGEPISMLETDAHGAFASELMPGRYRLSLVVDATTALMAKEIVCPEEVVIAPGARVDRAFELRRLRVRVRVVDAEGKPIAGRPFHVKGGSNGPSLPLQTDANGVLVIDLAPMVPFHLETWPAELDSPAAKFALLQRGHGALEQAMIRLGPIDVPVGKAEAAVELTVPAR